MNLRESAGMALAALRANKLRSFLTLLGTIIGVMSVIAVLSFVEGLNRFVSEKLLASGSNVFYVDKYGFITSQEEYEEVRDRPDITIDDADAIRAGTPHATLVIAQGNAQVVARYRNKEQKGVSLRGRSAGFELVDDYAIGAGRTYTDVDDQRRRMVCVIGPELAEDLFGNLDPVGRSIRLGIDTYEVIGVTVAKGKLLGQSQDRFAAIPMRTFVKTHLERGSIDISVKSVDQASMPLAQQEVRNVLRARRHLRPGQPDDFGITTSENVMQLYNTLTGGIYVVTIGVAAISLIVGGIVIMNIMLVSVTERTREIGIRKAMGAPRRAILTQFLVESTTLSVSGGLIGIIAGISLSLLAAAVSPLPAAVSIPSIIAGILMSGLIGIFFGSYPAWRAARLDPIEALRYE
ncbi:MAG TPA: ABC transporter permease [Candidatus Eisenbacteria bacterium]|nr:ABC transporter permease [Candidatus Eisenbacteria bacterium]